MKDNQNKGQKKEQNTERNTEQDKGQEKMYRQEKKPLRKLIGGSILLIVLAVLYAGLLLISNYVSSLLHSTESRAYQMNALSKSTEKALSTMSSVMEDVAERHIKKAMLEAAACRTMVEADPDFQPCMYQDGAIIRIEDGDASCPDDLLKDVRIDLSQMTEDSGTLISFPEGKDMEMSVVYYFRISGPYYYVEWDTYAHLEKEQEGLFNSDQAMAGIEKAFNVRLLLFPEQAGVDGQHPLIYASDELASQGYLAEDFGITQEMIQGTGSDRAEMTEAEADMETVLPGAAEAETETDVAGRSRTQDHMQYNIVTIGDTAYEVTLQKYDSTAVGETSVLACLVPFEDSLRIHLELTGILLAVFFIVGVFFLVWYCATLRMVRDHSLNDRQRKELSRRSIVRRSFSIILIGCVIILLASAMLFSLVRLFSTCRQVETAFSSMRQRIEENGYASDLTEDTRKKTYEGYAGQIARILENQPDNGTPRLLQDLCDLISADYIMLFDSNGDETLTNSRYVGLSLGTDPESSTYDFRRLLNGTEQITHDLEIDETTGEEHVMIGVSFGKPENGENYGALLLAVPGVQIYGSAAQSVDDVMSSLAARGLTAFSVNPETHMIVHASKSSYIGKDVQDIGLPEQALHGGIKDFYTIDGKPCYVECEDLGDALYYYAAEQSSIYDGVWKLPVLSAIAAAVLLTILAVFLLAGYGKFFAIWSEVGQELKEETEEIQLRGGRRKHSLDPSRRWRIDLEEHGIHTPFHVARLTALLFLMICIGFLGIRVLSSEAGTGESLLFYIIQGRWSKGVNLFAFTSIVILFFEVVVIVTLIRLLLRLISNALGTRGETICRLLINLAGYGGIIFFVYDSLYYLGLDPGTLLASLGLLSFAVSLGAKDLITDVIAGLSIVFEGEFQVGDIIDVGGYRGEVLEIGVRSTKLEGRGGNIKIISNRDIKNVINMTRMSSWYPLEVSISGEQPLGEVEQMLTEQLPHIGSLIPEIVSGPFYKGVTAIGKGTVTLSIIAECNEADYYVVQRSLNRAVQELFEQQGIKIM